MLASLVTTRFNILYWLFERSWLIYTFKFHVYIMCGLQTIIIFRLLANANCVYLCLFTICLHANFFTDISFPCIAIDMLSPKAFFAFVSYPSHTFYSCALLWSQESCGITTPKLHTRDYAISWINSIDSCESCNTSFTLKNSMDIARLFYLWFLENHCFVDHCTCKYMKHIVLI